MFNIRLILTLLNISGIGRKTVNDLLKNKLPENLEVESILNFLESSRYKIKKLPQLTREDILNAKNKCENIIKICKKENIKIITILDKEFPVKLGIIENNPVLIYYKGNFQCINNKCVAVIGTRMPTIDGEKASYNLGEILSKKNFTIVSGLALGCDTFAHRGCIDNRGKTVAVMPCGLDIIYPPKNKILFEEIIKNSGCLISEYPPNQKPYKNQFIERDRLQSALSLGVVVVQTSLDSGTMHTVKFAINQNKIIGCLKPSIKDLDQKSIQGNLQLLNNKEIYAILDRESLNNYTYILEKEFKNRKNISVKEEDIQLRFEI